jgi:hypothetical protein
LRFGGVAPLEDVEGVSFGRLVLRRLELGRLELGKLVLVGSPFELPGVCGDPPFD